MLRFTYMNSKVGIRKWLSFIIAGFVGQLAWAIENNYFNVYVFDCTKEYTFIPIMTAASAVAATVTTLLMGALSDRLGKRKAFISFGYILWGISIVLFAFLDPQSSLNIVVGSTLLSGTLIVIMDCIMTFFGSTANDASFNAFVTDNTNTSNRGKVESVLSVLPLIAMIAVVGVQGAVVTRTKEIVDGVEKIIVNGWDIFFYIFGGLTTLVGVICIFLLPKDVIQPNKEEPYIKNIFYGFRPSVIKNNKILYLVLLAFMTFSIGIQVFMPYLMVYIQNVLHIVELDFTITLGVVLIVASIITVVFGLFMDRIGKNNIMIPALGVTIAGAIGMFFVSNQVGVMIAGTIMMTGYMVSTAVLGAKVREMNRSGLVTATLPTVTMAAPLSKAVCISSSVLIPPPKSTMRLVSVVIRRSTSTFTMCFDFAPSRSTTCSRLNPISSKARATSTGSSL